MLYCFRICRSKACHSARFYEPPLLMQMPAHGAPCLSSMHSGDLLYLIKDHLELSLVSHARPAQVLFIRNWHHTSQSPQRFGQACPYILARSHGTTHHLPHSVPSTSYIITGLSTTPCMGCWFRNENGITLLLEAYCPFLGDVQFQD